MTSIVFSRAASLAGIAMGLLALVGVASCGSGAVSGPPVQSGGPLSILPSSATVYSDIPATFVVSGGNGNYIATSSDQLALPVVGTFTGNSLTVVPGAVAADTPVSITIRDTAAATPVSAALVVKPRTISNTVSVTPSASQSAACGTAVCSGGDAEVRVSLSRGGLPLASREVRFEVVSGDFRIITSAAGLPEALSLSGTALTDGTGTARIRVRVLSSATSQTALLQVTDVSSGFVQRTSFAIAPSSNAPLNAQPATVNFQGIEANKCAADIEADVIVFGGRPPYAISQPGSFTVTPTLVTQSGGRFTIRAIGQCTSASEIAVVDANGATVTVTASNRLSEVAPAPPAPAPFSVAPSSVCVASASEIASVSLSGGSGSYVAASGNTAILASVNGNLGSIQWTSSTAPVPATVKVTFSDGQTSLLVTVATVLGTAPCP